MAYEQMLLDGSCVTVYSKQEWFDLFVKHCNEICEERGGRTGEYCCGYHWCCNECEAKLCNGCADCVKTIIDIYESFGGVVDYTDIDFEVFEESVRKLYETKNRR